MNTKLNCNIDYEDDIDTDYDLYTALLYENVEFNEYLINKEKINLEM